MPKTPARTVFFNEAERSLWASLPITEQMGKVRVKRRSHFAEYGIPVATRSQAMSQADYIEWQIGYDLLAKPENSFATSLSNLSFLNSKTEAKFPYELSELIFHSNRFGWIKGFEIESLQKDIYSIPDSNLLDVSADMSVLRTTPNAVVVNGLPFYKMEERYPLLVHKFGDYEVHAEIVNREKQRGVGLQPMLYVCIPLTSLHFAKSPFGRNAGAKETAQWFIGEAEARLFLELFNIFGMLSSRHKHDALEILKTLFPKKHRATDFP